MQNSVNFKDLLLQIQKRIRQVVLCADTFIGEELNLFITTPGVAPLDPYRGLKIRKRGTSKENSVFLLLFQNAWSDFIQALSESCLWEKKCVVV